MWSKVKSGVKDLSLNERGEICQYRVRPFCCTVVKRGKLILRMRRCCVGGALYDQDDV